MSMYIGVHRGVLLMDVRWSVQEAVLALGVLEGRHATAQVTAPSFTDHAVQSPLGIIGS